VVDMKELDKKEKLHFQERLVFISNYVNKLLVSYVNYFTHTHTKKNA